MKFSITGILLACYFLAGSMIFPLSDFSLMRDLPAMYRSYCEVRTGKPDVCDFVGDYLLHGKELFGNNPHDAKPRNENALQFQHQPTLSIFFFQHTVQLLGDTEQQLTSEPAYRTRYHTSEYRDQHFRPPIA
ncbi:hypothetical protein SAMN05192574_110126 [Mucilaginibacter gossypiicola]|uniref:Uncharacterized protein n=1 Tax=Mucilaginibacter gossypiicola TaxID=551995 RepID=A0A1H8RFV2_9SPHI|nr:hypothetical protein [Mucilaginibacter gossypiicola]SEO65024.1 hypothetical protein SAMN05192574_110126 [Mucilaginibacter gossypiicola]